MSTPRISVLMAVYNGSETITDAVQSICEQSFTDWELIICDDGSTDSTPQVLENLVGSPNAKGRIAVIRNSKNRKLAYSLNRGLALARGEFIARMDADDISHPDRLMRQASTLTSEPELDLVATAMQRFDQHGAGMVMIPRILVPDKHSLAASSRVPFAHATMMIRRRVLLELGGYKVAWRTNRAEDLDLWFRFFAAGFRGRNLKDALYFVREDRDAVRRRTRSARLGAVTTRLVGYAKGRYPLYAYRVAAAEMLKILIPYAIFDWYRSWQLRASRERPRDHSHTECSQERT